MNKQIYSRKIFGRAFWLDDDDEFLIYEFKMVCRWNNKIMLYEWTDL